MIGQQTPEMQLSLPAYKCASLCLPFLCRFWGQNSGPHVCMENTLPTTPSPQATPHFYLFKYLLLFISVFYYYNFPLLLRISFMYTRKYDHVYGPCHLSALPTSPSSTYLPPNFMLLFFFNYSLNQ